MFITEILSRVVLPICVAAASGGGSREITENVDLIELNHYHDDLGRHSYDQVIFYEWSHDYSRFHVIAWYLVEKDTSRLPYEEPGDAGYAVRWYDRDAKAKRVVRSELFRETWSVGVDPERQNKRYLHEKHRISLLRPCSYGLR